MESSDDFERGLRVEIEEYFSVNYDTISGVMSSAVDYSARNNISSAEIARTTYLVLHTLLGGGLHKVYVHFLFSQYTRRFAKEYSNPLTRAVLGEIDSDIEIIDVYTDEAVKVLDSITTEVEKFKSKCKEDKARYATMAAEIALETKGDFSSTLSLFLVSVKELHKEKVVSMATVIAAVYGLNAITLYTGKGEFGFSSNRCKEVLNKNKKL